MRTLTESERQLIADSGLFDADWYAEKYRDVGIVGLDPLDHFLRIGIYMGREPGPLFDSKHYCRQLEQISCDRNSESPLVDYLSQGWREGLNPNPFFDVSFYLENNPDVASAGIEPLGHFIRFGSSEARNPHPIFDIAFYLEKNPDVAQSGVGPLQHFINYGIRESRHPIIRFSSSKKNEKEKLNSTIMLDEINSNKFGDSPDDLAIHAHIFYTELALEIKRYLLNIPIKFHLYVTTDTIEKVETIKIYFNDIQNLNCLDICVVDNRGRDIAPMIVELGKKLVKHDLVLHIHSKKSPHNSVLKGWRRFLLDSLLGSSDRICKIFQQFSENSSLGILFPKVFTPISPCMNIGGNYKNMVRLLNIAGRDCSEMEFIRKDFFPAGSMFWFRGKAIEPFLQMNLSLQDFEAENGQDDGTLAHAVERMFVYFANQSGMMVQDYTTHQFDPDSGVSGFDWLRHYIHKGEIKQPVILFDHNRGGGTNSYSRILTNDFINDNKTIIKCYYNDGYWFSVWCNREVEMVFASPNIDEVFETLSLTKSSKVIINSLYGYPDLNLVAQNILLLIKSLEATLEYKAHDFYSICPSPHLLDYKNRYCGVPSDVSVCSNCLKLNHGWYIKNSWTNDIIEWRNPFKNIIEAADVVEFFDKTTIEIFLKAFDIKGDKIFVNPHKDEYFNFSGKINLKGPLHVGVLGTLTMVKGGEIINSLREYTITKNIELPITIVGTTHLPLNSSVNVVGSYSLDDLPDIIRKNKINVVFMSSIVPETFSYTVSEAIKMGMPIVAFDIGAQGNRVRNYKLGKVVPLGSSSKVIFEAIQAIHKTAEKTLTQC